MEPKIVSRDAIKLVGIEFEDSFEKAYLIMNMWVALGPKLHLIKHPVEPHILYGVWHTKPGASKPVYLVGVQVTAFEDIPDGMVGLTVPAGRFVMLAHQGNMGAVGATYEAIMKWMHDTGAQHNEAATLEVYDTTQPLSDDYRVPIYEPIV